MFSSILKKLNSSAKTIKYSILMSAALIASGGIAYVFAFSTDSFILDKGYDLGAVTPQSGNWYKPTVKYTDEKGVQQRMLDGFHYPGNFYTDRGFTTEIIKGTDPYFKVDFNYPKKINSLSSVKSAFEGFQFSWRKNGVIQWTPSSDLTESYLAGYDSSSDSSVIVYPIKDLQTKKTVAYLQYPCGNLVCQDSSCSALKPAPFCGDGIVNSSLGEVCDPKDSKTKKNCTATCQYPKSSCSLSVKKESYYVGECVSVSNTKDSAVTINTYSGQGQTYKSVSCLKFDAPGTYKVDASATDKNTSKSLSCSPVSINVITKPVCGDGIIQADLKETCDLGKDKNGVKGTGCTSSCKLEKPSCSVAVKNDTYFKGFVLTPSFIDFKYSGLPKGMMYNGIAGSIGGNITVNACSNKVDYTVSNPLDPTVTVTCTDTFKADVKSYCGDGVVNSGEECDFKEGSSGLYCTSSCKLKAPSVCNIEGADEYYVGETAKLGVTKESYASISGATIGNDQISVSSSSNDFSVKLKTAGTYKVTVSVINTKNKNSSSVKSCEKTIVVKDAPVCN